MRTHARVGMVICVATIALILSACGGDKSKAATAPSRTIDITMADNTYQPTQLSVAKGETVRLRFKNTGTAKHEAILGDDAAQAKHHEQMTASTGKMEHGSGHETSGTSVDTITVEPGQTGEITHTFNETKSILIGCHEPGHWEAGMKATIAIN